ncbi:MAG: NADP-dependent isocitrate dehydrogenase [Rhodospirillales bacterium]|nr:NADP-dependent isocitrate dehydrogenase [Rhodospirillales bacterium]
MPDIIYTKVDEAPELASGSFLPIIKAFTGVAGVTIGTRDLSLAGRILANFSDRLPADQKQSDDLAWLGELVQKPEANVIKLPNISASIPQLKGAIAELQAQGYKIPDYPEDPKTDEERKIQATFDKVKGSAVNPVLREGNSDRRAPKAIKEFAKKNPHRMGKWSADSKTHVSTMQTGDFFSNEKSCVITTAQAGDATIEFVAEGGDVTQLKGATPLGAGDIVDASMMSAKALRAFYEAEVKDAKQKDILFSLHLKATMMKVSDPVIFGHAVAVYLKDVFAKHAKVFAEIGVDPDNGIGDLVAKVGTLPADQKATIEADLKACMAAQPDLFMVNSDRGLSNLHVPSDVIIDASLPVIIRSGGKAWGPDGKEADTKCVIPDSAYAGVYAEAIRFCRENGALDPATMGSVSNVGLMARKAEEYGSHPQTFIATANGTIRAVDAQGKVIHEHAVEKGDIWRMCMTRDLPIQNWVELAVKRARATGVPAVFWLNKARPHDAHIIAKVERYLQDHDTQGLDISIKSPAEATWFSMERMSRGLDTVSVTGNVLRDYLTDLFPILEVGTSAKMLSIVPLLNGGGLFETGAGGSAPKHVQQLVEEGHLRWDSLGEFCALGASLEHLSETKGDRKIAVIAAALDQATEQLLDHNQSPSRKVGELDNRGSHFFIAKYWAEALAAQDEDADLKAHFTPVAAALNANEAKILGELLAAQGAPVDLGGYYHQDPEKVLAVMRPSPTLNAIIG